jgi:hypothetical protein
MIAPFTLRSLEVSILAETRAQSGIMMIGGDPPEVLARRARTQVEHPVEHSQVSYS